MHKKQRKSISDIADAIETTEQEALDIIRQARRRLNEIMFGDK
jgi:hypothetical protein